MTRPVAKRCACSALLATLLFSNALAAPDWTSTWEDDQGPLLDSGWGTSSCAYIQSTGSPWPEGCNPRRTPERAHAGAKSLVKDYTGPNLGPGGDNNHGVYVTRFNPAHTDVWIRFWSYLTDYSACDATSCIDKIHYTYPAGLGEGPSWVLSFYFGPTLAILSQSESSASSPCNTATSPGTFLSCNYLANMNVSYATHPQNQWVCIEEHIKANSEVGGVPQADGALEVFRDGTQFIGYYDRRWSGVGQPYFSQVGGAIRIYTQTGKGKHFIDDFAVGNTRIGCGSSAGDTLPPAPATNLAAQ
ncbi:MAG: hypothetical protein K1X64_04930 [Myxococcaceae bacterium]|nr:hypothetical protein [Myxococcaceae bacterium]